MLLGQPVRQIAYFTDDIRAAARRHAALFGSGPFLVIENGPGMATHRGKQVPFQINTAFGQWGEMQVEFLEQKIPGPSVLHDLYPEGSGTYGFHHVALFVDDLEDAVAQFVADGHPEAMRISRPKLNLSAVFMDTVAAMGHFVELYEPVPRLLDLYAKVAEAAIGYTGEDPVREARF